MSSSFQPQMPTASSLFSIYAFVSALAMLIRSIFNEFIPRPVRAYFLNLFNSLFKPRSNKLTLVIEQAKAAYSINHNEVYDSAELYLSTKITNSSIDRLKISKSSKDKTLTIRFENGQQFNDIFDGIDLQWRFICAESPKSRSHSDDEYDPTSASTRENKFFELTLGKEHKEKVINNYIPYILSKSKTLKDENRTLKMCTLGSSSMYGRGNVHWDTTNLDHPSTFDTLAMDLDTKSAIKADLDRFVSRKEFYKRVGRAWKRGYLLHGPPGTGKSSLVAAMANYLKFDVYDLQLGNLISDSDLRMLLLATANRSILVIEDIDCSVDIKNRSEDGSTDNNGKMNKPDSQLTLSGLLNFIDGLWSSCGDERIIVFTTNHREKLDPALLRPGRMDMHIHMPYLTVQGFRTLASNYLEINSGHRFFAEIEELIESINVTPAQVAEELMRSEDADEALRGVNKLLKERKERMVSKEEFKKDVVENGHTENSLVSQNEG